MATPPAPSDLTLAPFYTGTASEEVQAAWLAKVWRSVFSEMPGLDDRLAGQQVQQQDVVDVVVSATLRVLRNPDGLAEGGGQIDDFTENYKFADASEDVYFTAAEQRRLAGADGDQTDTGWSGSLPYS